MIRTLLLVLLVRIGIPRESGDDPFPMTLRFSPEPYSPRERG